MRTYNSELAIALYTTSCQRNVPDNVNEGSAQNLGLEWVDVSTKGGNVEGEIGGEHWSVPINLHITEEIAVLLQNSK